MKKLICIYAVLAVACLASCKKDKEETVKAQVETLGATDIAVSTATVWGRITEQGTAGIVEYGIERAGQMIPATITKADSFGVKFENLSGDVQYTYNAYAFETGGYIYGAEKTFRTLAQVSFSVSFSDITEQSATVTFSNTEQLREWGFYWKEGSAATTSDTRVEASGSQSVPLPGLKPYTMYHILAYATGKNGLEASSIGNFRTGYTLPQLTMPGISDITVSAATITFEIFSTGGGDIAGCGIRYSIDRQKWTNKPIMPTAGAITGNLTGLKPATTYYVQAYAHNTGSNADAYSETVQFTTAGTVPALAKPTVAELLSYKVKMAGGNVIDAGLLDITEYGFCWSTAPGAGAEGTNYIKITTGSKDAFEYLSYDLLAGTKYYIRAYAKNAVGTGYSEEFILEVPLPQFGELVDARDGKKYKTVIIGNQEWMAEDLNYDYPLSVIDETGIRIYNGTPDIWPFPMSNNVPPEGWHIPTAEEIEEMLTEIGYSTNYYAGVRILTSGTNTTGLGLNVIMEELPYGYPSNYAWIWSSSSYINEGLGIGIAVCYSFSKYDSYDSVSWGHGQNIYLPVRCIKNK